MLLTALGAYLRLAGGNIEIHAPGKVAFHAGQKILTGPMRQDYPMPTMPRSLCEECLDKARQSGSRIAFA